MRKAWLRFGARADGIWKTEANDAGGYLQVTIGPCASDAKLTCGTISSAFTKDGPDTAYANLGKQMSCISFVCTGEDWKRVK